MTLVAPPPNRAAENDADPGNLQIYDTERSHLIAFTRPVALQADAVSHLTAEDLGREALTWTQAHSRGSRHRGPCHNKQKGSRLVKQTPLKVGLFGAGRISQIHGHNIANHPELELIVVCLPALRHEPG